MRSVGSKLTLLIVALPILSIVVFPIILITALSSGIFYRYRLSLEVSDFVEILSTLLSVVLVDMLVWERLRESLSKKLNYLHDTYLSELHSFFSTDSILHLYTPTVERIKPDLKRYGKFMGISLYPKDLPRMIGRFLIFWQEFNNRFEKIENIGKELLEAKLNIYLLCHVLGIKHYDGASLKQNKPMLKFHEEKAQLAKKENTKLIKETREYLEKAERLQKKILETLEDFFKNNSLEFEKRIS